MLDVIKESLCWFRTLLNAFCFIMCDFSTCFLLFGEKCIGEIGFMIEVVNKIFNSFHIILQSNYKYFLQLILNRSSNIVTLQSQQTRPSRTCSSSSNPFIIVSRPKASRPIFERCKCFINERIASSHPFQILLYL